MADRISAEERSKNMSAIRSKDTNPEVYFRKKLFAQGFRYRKNDKRIIGHPDVFLPKYRTAVFVNGCFWHRHKECKYAYTPKSRVEFWLEKFEKNVERDRTVQQGLHSLNLKSLIVWECTINKMKKSNDFEKEMLEKVIDFLLSDEMYLEL